MRLKKIVFLSLAFLLGFKPLPSALLVEEEYPVIILGGGIAALTAAVQVSQAGFQPLVITGPSPGGIIVQSHSVRNWPGEIDIAGAELADKLQKQAKACGTLFIHGQVIDVDISKQPFVFTVQNNADHSKVQKLKARTCIVALGALPKLLGVPGEQENLFSSIFTCAPCDGMQFKGKTVAVIGGGDSALTEAHYLSNLAKKVYVIVRKDEFRTIQPKYRDSILSRPNIEVIYDTTVSGFQKTGKDLTLTLSSSKGSDQLTIQGAFLAIGSLPNTELFKGKLELDKEGFIVLKNQQETSVPKVYAAGDVSDKVFKQAATAAGDATKAALQAQKYFGSKLSAHTGTAKASSIHEIASMDELRNLVSSSEKPVVVYFYSKSCSPCRSFTLTYDIWATQFKEKAQFVKACDSIAPEVFGAFNIRAIPSVVVLDPKGKTIFEARGSELAKVPSVLEQAR
jgi:thioredoxin reductase (NADPH)